MTELFPNISDKVRKQLESGFALALSSAKDPAEVADLLNAITEQFSGEEHDFAQFYFNMRLEAMNRENIDSER